MRRSQSFTYSPALHGQVGNLVMSQGYGFRQSVSSWSCYNLSSEGVKTSDYLSKSKAQGEMC